MPHELRTFGGLTLLGPDGEPVDAVSSPSKQSALLAYLAIRRRKRKPATREELLPLLWPEQSTKSGRNALRVTLSRLRGELPDGALRGRGEERLWIDESVLSTDVRTFRKAAERGRPAEALDLYRGDFLAGFHLSDAAPFNRWVDERRGALRRMAYEAALSAGDAARAGGKSAEAEARYRRALSLAPLKEEAAAGLIGVLAEQGDRTDALKLYRAFAGRLRDELELSPSEELKQLAERVRAGPSDPSPGPAEDGGAEAAPRSPAHVRGDREGTTERAPTPSSDRLPRPALFLAIAVLVVLAGMIVWRWRGGSATSQVGVVGPESPAASSPATAPEAPPTIVLLPLGDLNPDSSNAFLARGLYAQLWSRLSNVTGLEVVAGLSRLPDRGRELSPSAAADSLGARWALAGEIQRVGGRIQVSVRLIDRSTGVWRWAQDYRRDFTVDDVYEIQDDITRNIVDALEVEVASTSARTGPSPPTRSSAAYELYLQARGIHFERRAPEEEVDIALRLYRRALELDSTFARARAGLADLYASRSWRLGGGDSARALADSGVAAARRAIRRDPELAYAYTQLGDNLATLGRADAQVDAYRRALRVDPARGQALNNLIVVLTGEGRIAEAMRWLDRAHRHSPRAAHLAGRFAELHALLGRRDAARAWLEDGRRRGHELPRRTFELELYYRGNVEEARKALRTLRARQRGPFAAREAALALYSRDWEAARRRFRTLVRRFGAAASWADGLVPAGAGLAFALHRLGRDAEARSVAERTLDSLDERPLDFFGREGAIRLHRAEARLVLGDTARALRAMERAVAAGFRQASGVRRSPLLESLRHHPRFRDALSRMDSLLAEERRRVERAGWGEPPERVPAARPEPGARAALHRSAVRRSRGRRSRRRSGLPRCSPRRRGPLRPPASPGTGLGPAPPGSPPPTAG